MYSNSGLCLNILQKSVLMYIMLLLVPMVIYSRSHRAFVDMSVSWQACWTHFDSETVSEDVDSENRHTGHHGVSFPPPHSCLDTAREMIKMAQTLLKGQKTHYSMETEEIININSIKITLLQLPLFQLAHGCRLHVRAGSGLLMLAQSSSLWELHATVLHIAPIPHVVEHCWPNKSIIVCWLFSHLCHKSTNRKNTLLCLVIFFHLFCYVILYLLLIILVVLTNMVTSIHSWRRQNVISFQGS